MSDSDSDFFGNVMHDDVYCSMENVRISATIPEELRDTVQEMAKKDMRTFSEMIAKLIAEAVTARVSIKIAEPS